MNKGGEIGEQVTDSVIYLILVMLFVAGLIIFVSSQRNGAALWSDIYAKEIAKVINLAEPGDEIHLNIHKATSIALRNDVNSGEVFEFNNEKSEICIRLNLGRKSCYGYFNNVNVIEPEVELGVPINILSFKIEERK